MFPFQKKRGILNQTPVRKVWPSPLNPCDNAEHQRHGKATYWGVHGRVTKICVYCVVDREKQHGGDRTKALSTFQPDPSGNIAL